MSKPLLHIIPARFRVDEAYLAGYQVATMDFPFQRAVDAFLSSIKQIRNGKDLEYDERPPYSRINTVLLALSPALVHAFEERWNPETKRLERQALVLASVPRPTPDQIGQVVQVWGQQWAEHSFGSEIQGPAADAYQTFLEHLKQPDEDWREVDARTLLTHLDAEKRLSYRAIPSLLAALVARRSTVVNGRLIHWHLAHDGDRYIVVSDPFLSSYEDSNGQHEGTFAYKLEFYLQTQVGNPHPWIHLYVRCRRYADEEIKSFNWGRDVSVMIGIDQPRLEGWEPSPTFVTIPLTGGVKQPQWLDNPTELLTAIKARQLIEPLDLVKEPTKYRTPGPLTNYDRYFVVYAEGLVPSHDVKTGFDFHERGEVVAAVANTLELPVSLDKTLAPDEDAYLTRLSRPRVMFTTSDLAEKIYVKKTGPMTEEEHARQNQLARQRIASSSLHQALKGKPAQVIVVWSDDLTRKELLQTLRNTYFLGEQDPWPEGVEVFVSSAPVDSKLLAPLDPGNLNPQDHYKRWPTRGARKRFLDDWKKQMRLAQRSKTEAWESYLKEQLEKIPAKHGYQLVFIELHKLKRGVHESQEIKGAVRAACIHLGLASQMIFPTRLDKEGETNAESLSRAKSAVADLVQRQTGVLYDSPVELYKKAGLPEEIASELTIIALYKLSKTKPRISYPVAVRLHADGQIEVLLPGQDDLWRPYLNAAQEIGRIFGRHRKEEIKQEPCHQAEFAARVLAERTAGPTLVLLDAADWRQYNILPQFANRTPADGSPRKDVLELGHIRGYQPLYRQKDLPHLRVIRLRTPGTLGETPQYIAVSANDWEDMNEARDLGYLAGFEDRQAESEFFHYLSIGQMPKTAKRQKHGVYKLDEGGGVAFKHQSIVEFVPFFLQQNDDPLAWCRVPHFLRFSPAWDGGNVILPYPMHLAQAALQDQLCLLGESSDQEG